MKRCLRFVWSAFVACAGALPLVAAAQAPTPPPIAEPVPAPEPAEEETPAEVEIIPWRFAVHGGVLYGALNGSEIENADPLLGFQVGGSFRVLSDVSIWASFAKSFSNVDGQVVQLLDVPVRVDGRSGTVDGQIDFDRFRAGVRIDGLRQPSFRVQPYLVGAATFTKNKVELTSVDGRTPAHPSYDDSQIGCLAQFGVEVGVAPKIAVDGHIYYEVFEFPPATNASAGAGAGISYRH